jgi:hypothetical protein
MAGNTLGRSFPVSAKATFRSARALDRVTTVVAKVAAATAVSRLAVAEDVVVAVNQPAARDAALAANRAEVTSAA